MNTPAHLVINLAILGSGESKRYSSAIAFGALLPDLPMFFFYLWQKAVAGSTEALIWQSHYFDPHWQDFFDVFNSAPLALGVFAIARLTRQPAVAAGAASALLHFALDLPLHHDDGHRHLFPLFDWRFASPVSYWDPRHFGAWAAAAEVMATWASSAVLFRRHRGLAARAGLVLVCALSGAAYLAFYVFGVVPAP